MRDIKIIVAAHKPYRMPSDGMYLPVQVGASGKESIPGFMRDDTGDNISDKNPYYCELTGVYLAWKHVKADYVGLAHYRRHFRGKGKGDAFSRILTAKEADALLDDCDVLLPRRRHYYIETNRSQYVHAHHPEGLEAAENVIKEKYPDYAEAFAHVMSRTSGHRFNMFIMRADLFDSYCTWLFDVLGETEKRLDISGWSASEQRIYGYIAERLIDVWLERNRIKSKDIPYMFMEKQNWFKKIGGFLKRKFGRHSGH